MATTEHFCRIAKINPQHLSKEEAFLLEVSLLTDICNEFIDIHSLLTGENKMTYGKLIHLILNDLIKTNDYTLTGVAHYSNVPEEVIYDISTGINTNPSLEVSRKIIELHKSARSELYQHIMEKISTRYKLAHEA